MKDLSTRRKRQPKALRRIPAIRGEEEAGVLDGEGQVGVSLRVSGARNETLWPRTSLEGSKEKFDLGGLHCLLKD